MQPIYLYNMCGCVYVSVHARQVSSTKKKRLRIRNIQDRSCHFGETRVNERTIEQGLEAAFLFYQMLYETIVISSSILETAFDLDYTYWISYIYIIYS